MAFGDSPHDESLRKAWQRVLPTIAGSRRACVQGLQPRDAVASRGCVSAFSRRISGRRLISPSRRKDTQLSGAPCVLHAALQARRRRGRFRVLAGLDRWSVGLQNFRQSRHRALSQLHGSRSAARETTRHGHSESARSLRRYSGSESLRPATRSVVGWQLRVVYRRAASRTELAADDAGLAQIVSASGLRSLERTARAYAHRAHRHDRAATVADARNTRECDGLGGALRRRADGRLARSSVSLQSRCRSDQRQSISRPILQAMPRRSQTRPRGGAHVLGARADEALIVEFDSHDGFWMVSNNGVFFNSMDYLYRPVSYTPSRTKVDSDGKVRLIFVTTILAITTGSTRRASRAAI